MQIKIKPNAAAIYCRQFTGQQIPNREWADKLTQIQGLTLEVETDYLFRDQFNTAPIPGVSDLGLRVMAESVAEVIDDIRSGFVKCGWCGEQSPVESVTCTHCQEEGYLRPLDPAAPRTVPGLRRAGAKTAREGQPPQYPGINAYMEGYEAAQEEDA